MSFSRRWTKVLQHSEFGEQTLTSIETLACDICFTERGVEHLLPLNYNSDDGAEDAWSDDEDDCGQPIECVDSVKTQYNSQTKNRIVPAIDEIWESLYDMKYLVEMYAR